VTQKPKTSAEVQKAYNEWVHQYDTNVNPTRDINAKVLRQQSFDLAGRRVLELGCGTGSNTIWLADRAGFVVGLDIAEGMLTKARRRLTAGHVHILQADITKRWPLAPVFDVIVKLLLVVAPCQPQKSARDLYDIFAGQDTRGRHKSGGKPYG
jgi:SAM-dependent methyltransferase